MDASIDGTIIGMTTDGRHMIIETADYPAKVVIVLADVQDLPNISELRGKNVEVEGFAHYKNGEIGVIANTIVVREEKGFDLSENTCKPITPELVNWADKIISMAERNTYESPDYLLNNPKVTFWNIENPNKLTKGLAREMIEKIEKLVFTCI